MGTYFFHSHRVSKHGAVSSMCIKMSSCWTVLSIGFQYNLMGMAIDSDLIHLILSQTLQLQLALNVHAPPPMLGKARRATLRYSPKLFYTIMPTLMLPILYPLLMWFFVEWTIKFVEKISRSLKSARRTSKNLFFELPLQWVSRCATNHTAVVTSFASFVYTLVKIDASETSS